MISKLAIGAAAFFLVLIMLPVLALGGATDDDATTTSFKAGVIGQIDLDTAAVPSWAAQPLREATATCPEVTAPLLAAQIATESNWDPAAYNTGSEATGLSQFLPSTWAQFGIDGSGDGRADPYDPADAIASQAHYMCHLVEFVRDTAGLTGEIVDLALASYNAGPDTVRRHGGIPPFPETTRYVTAIRELANSTYSVAAPIPGGETGRVAAIIDKARDHVRAGTMYSWGGGTLNGPSTGTGRGAGVAGFDCSSLVRYAYHQGSGQAITLPRTSAQQYAATRSRPVDVADLQPGDLLFWGRGRIHHVALYVGAGRMIEAPRSGRPVTETAIRTGGDYAGATRVLGGPLDIPN